MAAPPVGALAGGPAARAQRCRTPVCCGAEPGGLCGWAGPRRCVGLGLCCNQLELRPPAHAAVPPTWRRLPSVKAGRQSCRVCLATIVQLCSFNPQAPLVACPSHNSSRKFSLIALHAASCGKVGCNRRSDARCCLGCLVEPLPQLEAMLHVHMLLQWHLVGCLEAHSRQHSWARRHGAEPSSRGALVVAALAAAAHCVGCHILELLRIHGQPDGKLRDHHSRQRHLKGRQEGKGKGRGLGAPGRRPDTYGF